MNEPKGYRDDAFNREQSLKDQLERAYTRITLLERELGIEQNLRRKEEFKLMDKYVWVGMVWLTVALAFYFGMAMMTNDLCKQDSYYPSDHPRICILLGLFGTFILSLSRLIDANEAAKKMK